MGLLMIQARRRPRVTPVRFYSVHTRRGRIPGQRARVAQPAYGFAIFDERELAWPGGGGYKREVLAEGQLVAHHVFATGAHGKIPESKGGTR